MIVNCLILAPPQLHGFGIIHRYGATSNITLTLDWNKSKADNIVDVYIITIIPIPQTHSNISIFTLFHPINVTVNYNVEYTLSITSVNCVGEGPPTQLSHVILGKHYSL